MAPILQGAGDFGIGYSHEQFVSEFQRICETHLDEGRAKSFAMIFYSTGDTLVWEALSSKDGFRILNQESGEDMTVFYLDTSGISSLSASFNKSFMSQLGVKKQVRPPCIVFFRVSDGEIEDVSFTSIDGRLAPHMIIEQLRRQIHETKRQLQRQGDLSGLNPVSLLNFIGVLRRVATGG